MKDGINVPALPADSFRQTMREEYQSEPADIKHDGVHVPDELVESFQRTKYPDDFLNKPVPAEPLPFEGRMSNPRIFHKALSADDVKDEFAGTRRLHLKLQAHKVPDLTVRMMLALTEQIPIRLPSQCRAEGLVERIAYYLNNEIKEGRLKAKVLMWVQNEMLFEIQSNEYDKALNEIKEIVKAVANFESFRGYDIKVEPDPGARGRFRKALHRGGISIVEEPESSAENCNCTGNETGSAPIEQVTETDDGSECTCSDRGCQDAPCKGACGCVYCDRLYQDYLSMPES